MHKMKNKENEEEEKIAQRTTKIKRSKKIEDETENEER